MLFDAASPLINDGLRARTSYEESRSETFKIAWFIEIVKIIKATWSRHIKLWN
jgi:hypothetical protein